MSLSGKQNKTPINPGEKYVYNDAQFANLAGSTRYDRENAIVIQEWYLQSHWEDAHIQQPDWSEFRADAWLLNGRSCPDTLQPSSGYERPATRRGSPTLGSRTSRSPRDPWKAGRASAIRISNLGYHNTP